jgi:hypothetical protein
MLKLNSLNYKELATINFSDQGGLCSFNRVKSSAISFTDIPPTYNHLTGTMFTVRPVAQRRDSMVIGGFHYFTVLQFKNLFLFISLILRGIKSEMV